MSKKDCSFNMWETENVTHKVTLYFLWCPGFRLQFSSLKVQLQPHETPCLAGWSEPPKSVIKIFTLGERIKISKGCFVLFLSGRACETFFPFILFSSEPAHNGLSFKH